MTPEEAFIRQSVAFARTLPFSDAITYLRGLLMMCGDHELTKLVRESFTELSHHDRQLSLIASGQLELKLDTQDNK